MGVTNSVPVDGSTKDPSSANALATLQNSIAKLTKKVNTVIEQTPDTPENAEGLAAAKEAHGEVAKINEAVENVVKNGNEPTNAKKNANNNGNKNANKNGNEPTNANKNANNNGNEPTNNNNNAKKNANAKPNNNANAKPNKNANANAKPNNNPAVGGRRRKTRKNRKN
jgi:hypothetical protein